MKIVLYIIKYNIRKWHEFIGNYLKYYDHSCLILLTFEFNKYHAFVSLQYVLYHRYDHRIYTISIQQGI